MTVRGDMFGRPLNAGDLVVIKVRGYQALQLAQVVYCTAKRVMVRRINHDTGNVNARVEQTQMAVFLLGTAEATDVNIKLLAQKAKENYS